MEKLKPKPEPLTENRISFASLPSSWVMGYYSLWLSDCSISPFWLSSQAAVRMEVTLSAPLDSLDSCHLFFSPRIRKASKSLSQNHPPLCLCLFPSLFPYTWYDDMSILFLGDHRKICGCHNLHMLTPCVKIAWYLHLAYGDALISATMQVLGRYLLYWLLEDKKKLYTFLFWIF